MDNLQFPAKAEPKPDDRMKLEKLRERWLKKIEKAEKDQRAWRDQAKDADEQYQNGKMDSKKNRFNLFWSNINIIGSALFASHPVADVRRRQSDQINNKPVAQAIERALNFAVDTTTFFEHVTSAVEDFLVTACGTTKIQYDTKFDDEGMLASQGVSLRHFHYKDFGWETSKKWEDVGFIWFNHWLSKKEIREEYGAVITSQMSEDTKGEQVDGEPNDKVRIREIYDKDTLRIVVICDEYPVPLELRQDSLGLKEFFPCAKPMLANCRRDKVMPKPDWEYYKSQAMQLDRLVSREEALTKEIKAAGFFDDSLADTIGDVGRLGDGDYKPVSNLVERLMAANGRANFDAVIAEWPIAQKVQALGVIREQIEAQKAQIYEITGISDIVRGITDPRETKGAQQLKGQWANVRLIRKQNIVNQYARQTFRIMAEIIGEHFSAEQLALMTGIELDEQQMMVLRDDMARSFAIDVETDSTVAKDEQEEQSGRLEMLKTVTEYLNIILPQVSQNLMPADLAKELLLMAVRSFKYGRNLEEVIESLPDTQQQLQQLGQQLQEIQQQAEQVNMQNQQLQGQLQQVNERGEAREDMKVQSEAIESQAEAQREQAHAAKLYAEAQAPQVIGL